MMVDVTIINAEEEMKIYKLQIQMPQIQMLEKDESNRYNFKIPRSEFSLFKNLRIILSLH